MTTLLWVIVGAIIFYLVLGIVKGKRDHKLKFRMKEFGNGMVWVGGLVLCMYIILFAISLLPAVVGLYDRMIAVNIGSPNAVAMITGMPLAFAILVFIFSVWFMIKVSRFRPFKYTEEERGIVNAENQKVRGWLLRGLRVFRLRRAGGQHGNKR